MSGPIPAGSPEVTTTTGKSAVTGGARLTAGAQPAQPQLTLFFGLALPDRAHALVPFDLVRRVVLAAFEHFGDVPAVAALNRFAERLERERRDDLLELRHELTRRHPTEVAALVRRAGVVRLRVRERREVAARDDL